MLDLTLTVMVLLQGHCNPGVRSQAHLYLQHKGLTALPALYGGQRSNSLDIRASSTRLVNQLHGKHYMTKLYSLMPDNYPWFPWIDSDWYSLKTHRDKPWLMHWYCHQGVYFTDSKYMPPLNSLHDNYRNYRAATIIWYLDRIYAGEDMALLRKELAIQVEYEVNMLKRPYSQWKHLANAYKKWLANRPEKIAKPTEIKGIHHVELAPRPRLRQAGKPGR